MIYTSYFNKLADLPDSIVPISICGKAPDWYNGIQYKKLAPKYSFFSEWKKNHDNQYYIDHFKAEVLDQLDPGEVVRQLNELSGNQTVVLICYENPNEFCHRHLVADWLASHGYPTREYNYS